MAPAFFWSALLTLPLYWVVWTFSGQIAEYLRWSRGNITLRASLWVVIITLGWVGLFGGNYSVLRDDTSTLPFMIAAIIFVSSIFIGSYTRDIKFAQRRENALFIALAAFVFWGAVFFLPPVTETDNDKNAAKIINCLVFISIMLNRNYLIR